LNRGTSIEARQPTEDQRTNQLIGRIVAIKFSGLLHSHTGDRRAAHYLHYHGGCGEELRLKLGERAAALIKSTE